MNYDSIKNSKTFEEYVELVKELKTVSLKDLSVSEKKSFLINIYNCLILHAIINGMLDLNGGTLARMKLYATAAYNIGGNIYSLNELENGLLRGNKKSAVPLTSLPFKDPNDPRKENVLPCDGRIHFALNCGAVSCPPVGVYSEEEQKLEQQLKLATEGFLDQSTSFNVDTRTVNLSMLFSWYKADFGGSDEDVLNWIRKNGSGELKVKFENFEDSIRNSNDYIKEPRFGENLKIKVAFDPYIWDLNNK